MEQSYFSRLVPLSIANCIQTSPRIIQIWWSSVPTKCPGYFKSVILNLIGGMRPLSFHLVHSLTNQTSKRLIWTRPNSNTHTHTWRTHTHTCTPAHTHTPTHTHTHKHTHSDLWECHQWEMMIESNHEQQTLTQTLHLNLSPPLSPPPSLSISLSLARSLSLSLSPSLFLISLLIFSLFFFEL